MTNLEYRSFGEENDHTILFLHGGGAAGWTWEPVVNLLSASFHCLVPDLPQHGLSAHVAPFTIKVAADLAADLIRTRAKDGRAVLVGLSEGAQIGVAMLSKHSDVLQSALLSGALSRPMPGGKWFTPGVLRWSYRWFVAPFKNADWYIRMNMRSAVGIPGSYYERFKADFQALTADSWANLMAENQAFRLPPGLTSVKTPVLVLTGEKEYGVMQKSARDLAAQLPQARQAVIRLPGKTSLAQSHNWPVNAPDVCADLIRGWISSGDCRRPEIKWLK